MGCGGSVAAVPPATANVATGVGTAFEFYENGGIWTPINDKAAVEQLGQLCAHNNVNEARYTIGSNSYKAALSRDGALVQVNVATNVQRHIRLVPFNFEFEEAANDWRPVRDPQAIMGLTAALASGVTKTYGVGQFAYEATPINDQGLVKQKNTTTQKVRHVRVSPFGADGEAYFEFREGTPGSRDWRSVGQSAVPQLVNVQRGRGDSHYSVGGQTYHARLGADGFIVQKNTNTGVERPIRPAPWLGHSRPRRAPAQSAGGASAVPVAGPVASTIVSSSIYPTPFDMGGAEEAFYNQVAMGTAEMPVAVVERPDQRAAPVNYVYTPPAPAATSLYPTL